MSNGLRKYRINKEIYEFKQNQASLSEYNARPKCLWEEIEDINELQKIIVVTDEIKAFLSALTKQREEQRLF